MTKPHDREAILYAFSIEENHDRTTLERYLREHPDLADELIDLLSELRIGDAVGPLPGGVPDAGLDAAWTEFLGCKPREAAGRRILLASNDPEGTYTAHLIARNLVLYLRGASRGSGSGKGGGRTPGHYLLTAEAIEMVSRHAAAAKGESSCHEDIPH